MATIIPSSPYFQNKNKRVVTVWKQIMCVCRQVTAQVQQQFDKFYFHVNLHSNKFL